MRRTRPAGYRAITSGARVCPKVNPVHRVRLYPRERGLSHRVSKADRAILDASRQAWNAIAYDSDMMTSLTDVPFIQNVRT